MDNIIDNSYDGTFFTQKILRLSAIVLGLTCIIILILDISNRLITYFDEDSKFELNFDELKKIRNLKSIKNFTFDEETLKRFFYEGIKTSNEEKNFKKNLSYFTSNLTKYKYKGIWKTKQSFGELDNKNGVLKLYISHNENETEKTLRFEMVFLDGEFIDKWTYISTIDTIIGKDSNISFDSNIFISSNIISNMTNGAILQNSFNKNTLTNIYFTWIFSENNNQTTLTHINGNITVSNTDIQFEVVIDDGNEIHKSILFYSLIVTLLSTLQLFSTSWLNDKVSDSQTKYKSVSIITICQNIIWNAYGCLINLLFSLNYKGYFIYFGIPALIYFVNFSFVELKLLYNIWKNQNQREILNENTFRSRLIRFYLLFYISLFTSLFFVTNFYFQTEYIIFVVALTWIPQIIHNYKHYNHLSLPLLNVISISMNKIAMPIYFRGSSKNFLNLAYHPKFSVFYCVIILIEIIFLYFQNIYGPKFFLPRAITGKPYDYYKTKEEVLSMFSDSVVPECIICLVNIFNCPIDIPQQDDFKTKNNLFISRKYCLKNSSYYLLDFHKILDNSLKKPLMVTPCNHVFHSNCLELWFLQKKECPTCRSQELE